MAVGRHRKQIDLTLFGEANELRCGIAHRQLARHFETMRRQIRSQSGEIIPIVLHLFGFAQLQLIEVPCCPPVGNVHEVEFSAGDRRQLADVIDNRLVCGRVFDGDEDAAIHAYANVW